MKIVIIIIIVLVFNNFCCLGQLINNYWIGSTTGQFNDSSNWSANRVPAGTTDYTVAINKTDSHVYCVNYTPETLVLLFIGNQENQNNISLVLDNCYWMSGTLTISNGASIVLKRPRVAGYSVDGGLLRLINQGAIIIYSGLFARNIESNNGLVTIVPPLSDASTKIAQIEYSYFDLFNQSLLTVNSGTHLNVVRGITITGSSFVAHPNSTIEFQSVGLRPYTFRDASTLQLGSSNLKSYQLVIQNQSKMIIDNTPISINNNISISNQSILEFNSNIQLSTTNQFEFIIINNSTLIFKNHPLLQFSINGNNNNITFIITNETKIILENSKLFLNNQINHGNQSFQLNNQFDLNCSGSLTDLIIGNQSQLGGIGYLNGGFSNIIIQDGGSIGSLNQITNLTVTTSLSINGQVLLYLTNFNDTSIVKVLVEENQLLDISPTSSITIYINSSLIGQKLIIFSVISSSSLSSSSSIDQQLQTLSTMTNVYIFDQDILDSTKYDHFTIQRNSFIQDGQSFNHLEFTLSDSGDKKDDENWPKSRILSLVLPLVLGSLLITAGATITILYIKKQRVKTTTNKDIPLH
ncbi:hypothetical protein DFA_01267 [Cavenderia fasciculata]|uniref:Transmembrane protein n=1 Tax=Cavenderia fasciculata TaxID=261658 RepID=F4PRV0_CACFS|nr:uncharacterized protein DFA_01267 [Cavenderia fasciculata]EGG21386.1 hypothetical protein DFA_01267 [Cavenderia fasciculata]|eukprot:XP_004359236.1 hypothetical protein DFA_01267 [Cavenderia fasciculata]